jgi:thioredoxin reductase
MDQHKHSNLTELENDLRLRLLQTTEHFIKSDNLDFFIDRIRQFLLTHSQNNLKKSYDVIIVGGGIAGASAALTLSGSDIKVLVIDKSLYPSVFGRCGAFFFNIPYEKLLGSPFTLTSLSPPRVEVNSVKHANAEILGKHILLNLFFSSADVLLGQTVTEIAINEKQSPDNIEITTGENDVFYGKKVIISCGIGPATVPFGEESRKLLQDEVESKKENASIIFIEDLLASLLKNPKFALRFKGKKVAIIGAEQGGACAAMSLTGNTPQNLTGAEKCNKENGNNCFPKEIIMFGRDNVYYENNSSHALLNAHIEDGLLQCIPKRAISLKRLGSHWRIGGERNGVEVDYVVIACGYGDPKSVFSTPDSSDIHFAGGSFIPNADTKGHNVGLSLLEELKNANDSDGRSHLRTMRNKIIFLDNLLEK